MNDDNIRFLDLLGINEGDAGQYTIRLNSGRFFNILDRFFADNDEMMEWMFTEKWPDDDKAKGRINKQSLLKFIHTDTQDKNTRHTGGVRVHARAPTHASVLTLIGPIP